MTAEIVIVGLMIAAAVAAGALFWIGARTDRRHGGGRRPSSRR